MRQSPQGATAVASERRWAPGLVPRSRPASTHDAEPEDAEGLGSGTSSDGGIVDGKEDIFRFIALHFKALGLGAFFCEALRETAGAAEALARLAGEPAGPCWREDAAAAGLRRSSVEAFLAGRRVTNFKALTSPPSPGGSGAVVLPVMT